MIPRANKLSSFFLHIVCCQVTDGARVVYGDGTSGALIRAAGVQQPTAIAITYSKQERCLKATVSGGGPHGFACMPFAGLNLLILSSPKSEDGKVKLSELVKELLRTTDSIVGDNQLMELLGCKTLDDQCMVITGEVCHIQRVRGPLPEECHAQKGA